MATFCLVRVVPVLCRSTDWTRFASQKWLISWIWNSRLLWWFHDSTQIPLHVQDVIPMLLLSKSYVYFLGRSILDQCRIAFKYSIFSNELLGLDRLDSENVFPNILNRWKVSIVSLHTFFFSQLKHRKPLPTSTCCAWIMSPIKI